MPPLDDTIADTLIVQLRARLAAAEARYATLASAVPDSWALVCDHELHVVVAHGAGLDRASPLDALRNRVPLTAFLPPESAAVLIPHCQQALAGTASALSLVIWERAYDMQTLPLRDGTGRISEVLLFANDVSSQQTAAAAIRATAEQLRMMVTNLPIVLYTIDCDGLFTYSTGKGLADLGLQPGQVVGLSVFDIYRDYPELLDVIRRGLAGESLSCTIPIHVPGGSLVFDMWYEPIRDQAGNVPELLGIAINVTDRAQAEAERSQLHEQVIQAQQAALRELSTPLLPISNEVLVLPVIGTVDTRRAAQLIESLLHGIAERKATTAIIDITGVQLVDTQVANALVQMAQAGQLLGAQVVLTGIRPEVAQTLISLGVELRGIITHATLQSGIAFALNEVRRGGASFESLPNLSGARR